MRVLILMRGLPGSGKSTFLKNKELEPYVVSPDNIRMLHDGLILDESGSLAISQGNDKNVWNLVHEVIENRMKSGKLVIVDGTHLETNKFEVYKKLKEDYRYRVYMLDFSEVGLDETLIRNNNRTDYKRVPEYVVRKMDTLLRKQSIPGWVEVIKPEDIDSILNYQPINLNEWKKIHHIGDLHGCNTVLREYLEGRLKEDELYIFCGDYLERGIENTEIISFLLNIYTKKNVILLEGNHEKYLYEWSCDKEISGYRFKKDLKNEFEEAGISKKDVRKFYRKLRQMFYYEYGNKRVLVSHGGITNMVDNLILLPTDQFVLGVGNYETDVDNIFNKNILNWEEGKGYEYYQVHGHRNEFDLEVQIGRSFNLEGKIERGGHLRALTLSEEGFKIHEIKNNVFNEKYKEVILNNNLPISDYVEVLRNNRYINERDNGNGLSSFNFNSKAFYDGVWNNQTVKARGLHIDVLNNEIVLRSYDKFFNESELEETKLENLEKTLKYPLKAFEKENGYLGLIGVHKARSEFYISSKGSSIGKYADMIKDLFIERVSNKDKVKEYINRENVTLVFEVIKNEKDPHIIEYQNDELILLDIVYNKIEFKKKSYEEVVKLANLMGIKHKELGYLFNNFKEFNEFYKTQLSEDPIHGTGKSIEGYVIEDAEGYLVKIKNPYYKYWKYMRGILNSKGNGADVENRLGDDFSRKFVDWADREYNLANEINIIELRNRYIKELSL